MMLSLASRVQSRQPVGKHPAARYTLFHRREQRRTNRVRRITLALVARLSTMNGFREPVKAAL